MSRRKSSPQLERRRSARADASLSMRVERAPTDGDLTKIVTESQNISASGVYCNSPHYLAPLSKVALTIVLPRTPRAAAAAGGRRLLKCDGIVVRCLPAGTRENHPTYELACSFVALETRHRDMIEEFVTWRNLESLGAAVSRPAVGNGKRVATGAGARRSPSRRSGAPTRSARAGAPSRPATRTTGSAARSKKSRPRRSPGR